MRTTSKQRDAVIASLVGCGFNLYQAQQLRRIASVLRRWAELECGTDAGHIERDEQSGKPVFVNARDRYVSANDPRCRSVIPDRERGAMLRLDSIMRTMTGLSVYRQTDPRGCSLYVLRAGDIRPGEDVHAVYNRGVAVY